MAFFLAWAILCLQDYDFLQDSFVLERVCLSHELIVREKELVVELRLKQPIEAPSWHPSEQPNPPLGAAKAIKNSRKYLSTLVDDADLWELGVIILHNFYYPVDSPDENLNRWYYEIFFIPPENIENPDSILEEASILVLMDGTVVEGTPVKED